MAALSLLSACTFGAVAPDGRSPLDYYVRANGSFALAEIETDLSGIAYSEASGTHFLVQNGAAMVYEYSADLRTLLRTIRLSGGPSRDFEGIAWLGGSEFALANELNRVVLVRIPPERSVLEVSVEPGDEGVQEFVLPPPGRRNKGLEGVCYAPAKGGGPGTLFAVQESSPRRVFRFARPAHGNDASWADGSLAVDEPFDAESVLDGVADDLSGCAYDPRTGRLLIVSHKSSLVVDVSLHGDVVRKLPLPGRLRRGAWQYEGITLGPGEALFLVSEPSPLSRASRALVYRYHDPPPANQIPVQRQK